MHELSLAQSLVEQVQTLVESNCGSRVLSVSVSAGPLAGVDRGSFEFCFPLACEGTLLEGASLIFEETPVRIACNECGGETEVELPALRCGACGSSHFRITSGKDFLLTAVEVEEQDVCADQEELSKETGA